MSTLEAPMQKAYDCHRIYSTRTPSRTRARTYGHGHGHGNWHGHQHGIRNDNGDGHGNECGYDNGHWHGHENGHWHGHTWTQPRRTYTRPRVQIMVTARQRRRKVKKSGGSRFMIYMFRYRKLVVEAQAEDVKRRRIELRIFHYLIGSVRWRRSQHLGPMPLCISIIWNDEGYVLK